MRKYRTSDDNAMENKASLEQEELSNPHPQVCLTLLTQDMCHLVAYKTGYHRSPTITQSLQEKEFLLFSFLPPRALIAPATASDQQIVVERTKFLLITFHQSKSNQSEISFLGSTLEFLKGTEQGENLLTTTSLQ
jgi:hypothetical protein